MKRSTKPYGASSYSFDISRAVPLRCMCQDRLLPISGRFSGSKSFLNIHSVSLQVALSYGLAAIGCQVESHRCLPRTDGLLLLESPGQGALPGGDFRPGSATIEYF